MFQCAIATVMLFNLVTWTAPTSKLVIQNPATHQITYTPDANGNTIPDFSNCGYEGGGVSLPNLPALVTLTPSPEPTDDTSRIQAAIDALSAKPVQPNHYRGAIFLTKGTYRISSPIHISASGIVIRGESNSAGGTLLVSTSTKQDTLFEITGKPLKTIDPQRTQVIDTYVPVGSRSFTVASAKDFKVGQTVLVSRVGNAEWISTIGMDKITPRAVSPNPQPGEGGATQQWTPFDLHFDRIITAISGNTIALDAPLTCAIEAKWGGGYLTPYNDDGRISHIGLESFAADSRYDPNVTSKLKDIDYPSDENHATYIVRFSHTKNAFARNLTATHFYHGVSDAGTGAKWITIQDCKSIDPVSKIVGGRRYPFAIQGGQLILYNRCYSRDDRHAFVVGARVCGPNTFLDCTSENPHATSEPHHRWSVGGLYDNVHADIAFQDRQNFGTGHGWSGANYVAWNCTGSLIIQSPPTAQNWSIGFTGKSPKPAFNTPPRPPGVIDSPNMPVLPTSLYKAQLQSRLGADALKSLEP